MKEYVEDLLLQLWWDSLSIEECFNVKYMILYQQGKELGLKGFELRKMIVRPPDIKPKVYCYFCKKDVTDWGSYGIIGKDYHFCEVCYETKEKEIEVLRDV